jgi:hypothetical protein
MIDASLHKLGYRFFGISGVSWHGISQRSVVGEGE